MTEAPKPKGKKKPKLSKSEQIKTIVQAKCSSAGTLDVVEDETKQHRSGNQERKRRVEPRKHTEWLTGKGGRKGQKNGTLQRDLAK